MNQRMLARALAQLRKQKRHLDEAIEALEALESGTGRGKRPKAASSTADKTGGKSPAKQKAPSAPKK